MLRAQAILTALLLPGCVPIDVPLPQENLEPVDTTRYRLVARLAHISDSQIVDEESPARLTWADAWITPAWRRHEAYSTQLLDGFVRVVNQMHEAGPPIDFLLHTGDCTDNVQGNELHWFMTVMDGGVVDPLSGEDDRTPDHRPQALLDPHAPFLAQGLYRKDEHGTAPDLPWYVVAGNHDHFAQGVFPIYVDWFGERFSPLPLFPFRLGAFIPARLQPLSSFTFGRITPADPGPAEPLSGPVAITPNAGREFFAPSQFVAALQNSDSSPPGHGFDAEHPQQTWYSVSPAPGLRLVGLDSARPTLITPGNFYPEGAIDFPQLAFLRRELTAAQRAGEIVVVATHHPSVSLRLDYGSAASPLGLRNLLNEFPCVALHLCGHSHRNDVYDRGRYVEMETGSTLDYPQFGRIIEIWSDAGPDGAAASVAPAAVQIRYRFFSHLDEVSPPQELQSGELPLFSDPLRALRQEAARLAEEDFNTRSR